MFCSYFMQNDFGKTIFALTGPEYISPCKYKQIISDKKTALFLTEKSH